MTNTEGQVREQTRPDVTRFNNWAATYDRSIMQRFFFEPVHARLLDLLSQQIKADTPSDAILDIGCGTGRLLGAAALRWPKARLLGVDPAERMISVARQLLPQAALSIAPAESLPLPDQSADIVFTSMSFHHWEDQERGIEEIARVLRPGGWFCLADHAFMPARLLGERVRSRTEVRAILKRTGLVVQRQLTTVPFVLFTLAQKL